MKITETNCETGLTIERDMTPEEELEHAARLSTIQNAEEEQAAAIIIRENALAKLQAIGLTEEEARSIFGGSSA